MPSPLPIAIVGAAGYSGAELLHLALGHARVEAAALFGSAHGSAAGEKPAPIAELHPRFAGRTDLAVRAATPEAIVSSGAKAVFLCTPHEVSHDLAPALVSRGLIVLDLSAAFRLKDPALYPAHYGFTHAHTGLLDRAPYGLPELFREKLRDAALIAVPGCYPTSAILPLAPLVRAGAIAPGRRPVIDSTSGVSGAGRAASIRNLFCEVSQQPYGVFAHRHQPEIDAYAGTPTIFTPHLGPFDRGILSTVHADLAPGWDDARLRAVLDAAYAREPFVRVCPPGRWPSVKAVERTNRCDLALAVEPREDQPRHAILVAALDNLVKGAAGQALQCCNIRFGFDETEGLPR